MSSSCLHEWSKGSAFLKSIVHSWIVRYNDRTDKTGTKINVDGDWPSPVVLPSVSVSRTYSFFRAVWIELDPPRRRSEAPITPLLFSTFSIRNRMGCAYPSRCESYLDNSIRVLLSQSTEELPETETRGARGMEKILIFVFGIKEWFSREGWSNYECITLSAGVLSGPITRSSSLCLYAWYSIELAM